MYKLNLIIILVITVFLVLLYLNNSEHFSGTLNTEAVTNISSLYNAGNLTASTMNATDNLNAKKINVNNGLVEMGSDQDKLLIRSKRDNNDNSFWFFNKDGKFGRYNPTTQKDTWAIIDNGSANFTTEVKTGKLVTSNDVEIGGKTTITHKNLKDNGTLESVSLDIREYISPGFLQSQNYPINLVKGFMTGWTNIHGRKLWAKLYENNKNTPITFAGNITDGQYHFIKVNPGFKVRLWHWSTEGNFGTNNTNETLSLVGPTIYRGTRCHLDNCEKYKNMPYFDIANGSPLLTRIHLIWVGYSEEPWPTYPLNSKLQNQIEFGGIPDSVIENIQNL